MFKKVNTGLVVVDIQGKLAEIVDDSELLISNTLRLIKGATTLGLPMVWVEQNPDKLGPTTSILQDALASHTPITKYTFDATQCLEFVKAVKQSGASQWLVCGLEAHICVYQTCLGLIRLGYEAEVVSDCVSARTKANKNLALAKLAANGVGITSVEMCLYELIGDCRAAVFNPILKLIK